ncbi:MAG: P-type conjugative transfer protein TrbG [Paracoccaceae bacterium]|nr:P-type conjugative transfer protein TrbG [Paracoccaceae bacterium]
MDPAALTGQTGGVAPAASTAQDNVGAPTATSVLLPDPIKVPLSFKEARGVELANAWKDRPDLPRQGPDGEVIYLYGATMPTMVCSPLEVCTIRLEPGEKVNDVHAGDTARWRISPSMTGSGSGETTLVVVKPTEAGLSTDLFITTDRRPYIIKLVSDETNWIPMLSFDYPADVQAQWAAYKANVAATQRASATAWQKNTLPNTGGQNLANLDFSYRLGGDHPAWMPVRVYTDGRKTYIQFPGNNFPEGAPALVSLAKGGSTVMVNYRLTGDRYVVDRVLHHAELLVGAGDSQERVTINKVGG